MYAGHLPFIPLQQHQAWVKQGDKRFEKLIDTAQDSTKERLQGESFSCNLMNDINLGAEVLDGLEEEKWLSNRWLSEHTHHSNDESKNKTKTISVGNWRQYNVHQQEPNYSQTRQEDGVHDQKIPVSNILEDQFHGVVVSQYLAVTHRYLNTVRKAEHNHIGGDEAHCAHHDQYGIKGYCHKTSSPHRLKGYMSAKLLDLDDKKEVVFSLSIKKHNRDIFSSFIPGKCTPHMLLKFDLFTTLALLQEDAGARLALLGPECNESKDSCTDSTPVPCSSPARSDLATQRECSVGRLSRKTKALRMRMRRAAETRYKDYISSSDEDH